MDKTAKGKAVDQAQREFPGAGIDQADNNDVTKKEVRERTRTLNNNPRNTDNVMPDKE